MVICIQLQIVMQSVLDARNHDQQLAVFFAGISRNPCVIVQDSSKFVVCVSKYCHTMRNVIALRN